jgi:urease accessory protein
MLMPGVKSRLQLAFHLPPGDCQSRLRLLCQEPPQRVVRAFGAADGGMALAHLHNLSGGILGGDQLQLEVTVGVHAQAQVTTTGATRIYRHRPELGDACQQTRLQVESGGLLEYLPDPIIPYGLARYQQQTRIDLAQDAGLFYWEVVTPGREAAGEIFAYSRLGLALELYAAGEPVALEHLELEPARRSLSAPLRLGGYRYFATLYICRVGADPAIWSRLERELAAQAAACSTPGTVIWGASSLVAHGLVVRGLSMSGRRLTEGLYAFWAAAKAALYAGSPRSAALQPRKLY